MAETDYRRIPLRARDHSIRGWALVDPADYDWLNQWRWSLNSMGSVWRRVGTAGKPGTYMVLMHRQILGLVRGDGLEVDHLNGNRRDNRRRNLRACTHAENMQNQAGRGGTSRYRGVSWDRHSRKWRAQAMVAGRKYNLGRYGSEAEARAARLAFEREQMPFSLGDERPWPGGG